MILRNSLIHPIIEIQSGILSEIPHEKPTAKLTSRFISSHPSNFEKLIFIPRIWHYNLYSKWEYNPQLSGCCDIYIQNERN